MHIAFKPRPAVAGTLLAILMPAQVISAAALAGDFDGYAVASNTELDGMRGGFEINIGGQLLNLAFSLERVTYLNGELQALTRIVVPDIAAAIASRQGVTVETFVAQPVQAAGQAGAAPGETSTQQAAGGSAPSSPAQAAPQIATAVVPAAPAGGGSASAQNATALVTLIQNGAGNSVALPTNVNDQVNQQVNQAIQAAQAQVLQATNQVTVIQNTLDNQVIRNLTTLNVTLTNAALARAAELSSALQNLRNLQIGVQP